MAIGAVTFDFNGTRSHDETYFDELAGLSDPEIVRTWLGSTVPEPVREAVRFAAERVPVAVVSGAVRAEIEPVLDAAGLAGHIGVLVAAEAAGMQCIAVLGTLPPERLAAADEVVPALDLALLQRMLG